MLGVLMKIRVFKESNYKSVFFNGKTLRFALDESKPITELIYSEFYDISINNICNGKCPYCYADAKTTGHNFDNIVGKAKAYFGNMTDNQRPNQCAIGAAGEPTMHPDFVGFMKALYDMNIMPNYTTNGMFLDNKENAHISNIIEATKKYCGGVAVSCHPHLKHHWMNAADLFYQNKIKLNFHIIISDKESIDDFMTIYNLWKDKVDYFVLLPYGAQGRAVQKEIDWDYLISVIPDNNTNIAYGANFYPYLKDKKVNTKIKISLYEPEIFSKYISLENNRITMYPSSFNLTEVKTN
jgi:hypothetical protein